MRRFAVGLSLLGALLITSQAPAWRAVGFGAWIVANVFWVRIMAKAGEREAEFLFGIYFILAVLGLCSNLGV